MTKMKDRNAQLRTALGAIAPKERILEAANIPQENTKNLQGHAAYALQDELRLIAILNTIKLQDQFYRSENAQMKELRDLIEKLAITNPYFVCQAIVYARCLGEGMRSVNHLAAALVAPFISGEEYAKRFYGLFDKKNKKGGTLFRVDDMSEIQAAYEALTGKALSNAMKKGFASALENLDVYQLAKYKKTVIDIANLVHPNSGLSKATVEVEVEGQKIRMKALDAIMKGINITADTWESAQSEAGQEVAKAVREGKLTKQEAEKVLAEAKADNWESLLKDGKLGVMAALRNIRNIMKTSRQATIDAWCELITNPEIVRKALILPIHFDLAYDVVDSEFRGYDHAPQVMKALQDGYVAAIPNLAQVLTGKTLIIVDNSGSMGGFPVSDGKTRTEYNWNTPRNTTRTAAYKAGLIAATFVKALNADVIRFGGSASWYQPNIRENVFSMAEKICDARDGWTNPAAAFELITRERKHYDRIIFISDNEVNGRLTSDAYRRYVHDVCSPYIYGVDVCAYGTTPLAGDKVKYFCGYGPMLYEDIAASEFNPAAVIDKVKAIQI